jgi:hypothetical protein
MVTHRIMIGLHSRIKTNYKRAEHVRTPHILRKIVVTILKNRNNLNKSDDL